METEERNGCYSALNQRVKQLSESGAVSIIRKDLASYLDLSEMDRAELEEKCANAMAAVVLYQNGFRSFVKGRGVYIDPKKMRDARFVQQLVDNAVKDRDKREVIIEELRQIRNNCISNYSDGSKASYMDFDENGNITVKEELNIDEAVDFLEKLARFVI